MPRRNQYLTPYAKWLLTEHLPDIANPRARLIEAMWRRGFVAINRGSYIHLPAKFLSMHDFEDIHPVIWITGVNDNGSLNLRWPKRADIDGVIEKFILLPSARGMTRDWSEWRNSERWYVPTAEMDLGVALYVKSLWLQGIDTKWSCDGHGKSTSWVKTNEVHDIEQGRITLGFDLGKLFDIARVEILLKNPR